jgi:hypothetical protein
MQLAMQLNSPITVTASDQLSNTAQTQSESLFHNWEFNVWIVYLILVFLTAVIALVAALMASAKAQKANSIAEEALLQQKQSVRIAQESLDLSTKVFEAQNNNDRGLAERRKLHENTILEHLRNEINNRIAGSKNSGLFISPQVDQFGRDLAQFVINADLDNIVLKTELLAILQKDLHKPDEKVNQSKLIGWYTTAQANIEAAFAKFGSR